MNLRVPRMSLRHSCARTPSRLSRPRVRCSCPYRSMTGRSRHSALPWCETSASAPPRTQSDLREFADRINRAERPLLVLGPEVDRAGGWDAGIAFAEKFGAPVRGSALADRVSFPETHPLYAGPMPMTIAEVNQVLEGHDLVVVIGAQVFRYYPYVAGDYLPEGTELLQIAADPHLTSIAPVGDSVVGDVRIALEQLLDMIETRTDRPVPVPFDRNRAVRTSTPSERLTADEVYSTLAEVKPADSAVVMESTSTMAELAQWLPTTRTGSFFATGSGGIGWGVPGAVGLALGDRERGVERTIVATIGDGSFQYSIQAIPDRGAAQAAGRLRGAPQRGV